MSDTAEPWTIERICDALGGSPEITKRVVSEINKATAADLLDVFTKWQGRAERTVEAVARGRAALANGTLYDDTVDITDHVMAEAARIRDRHAA